jgi:hypothetical protein
MVARSAFLHNMGDVFVPEQRKSYFDVPRQNQATPTTAVGPPTEPAATVFIRHETTGYVPDRVTDLVS